RHVFYLWHHWRRDHDHHNGQGCGRESPQLNHTDAGLSSHPHTASPRGVGLDRVESRNGQAQEGQDAMEVDGVGVQDPRDTKRLKRGPPGPCPPALPSEHVFVASVLEDCRSPEQGCFALAYRKWLDSVIDLPLSHTSPICQSGYYTILYYVSEPRPTGQPGQILCQIGRETAIE
ncbi:unnamed protein product, partial [Coregonus sp. 'balchen']